MKYYKTNKLRNNHLTNKRAQIIGGAHQEYAKANTIKNNILYGQIGVHAIGIIGHRVATTPGNSWKLLE